MVSIMILIKWDTHTITDGHTRQLKSPSPRSNKETKYIWEFFFVYIFIWYNRCVLLLMVITDGINHDSHQMRHTSFQCSCIWNGIIEGYHHKAVAAQWDFWTQFFSDTIFPRKVSSAYSVRFCRNYITLIRYFTNNSCFKHYLQKYGTYPDLIWNFDWTIHLSPKMPVVSIEAKMNEKLESVWLVCCF